MDQKTQTTTDPFDHKNHVKQYREGLRMRATKLKSSAQNKSNTQTLREAFALGTRYDKEQRRSEEITAAVTTYICTIMASI